MTDLGTFSFTTVVLRLALAMSAAGFIGYGRTRKRRTAGLRTHMLTGLGAALTTLLAIYEYQMMLTLWADQVAQVGLKFDGSRFSAQVISGIGFLASGSIIAAKHQQVKGLTTATGLFASVCMGIAAGAGFYSCVIISTILIFLVLEVLQPLENRYKRRIRTITLSIEFYAADDLERITNLIKSKNAEIQDIEIESLYPDRDSNPNAVFSLRLSKEASSHSEMLSSIAELDCVNSVEELIA